MSSPNAILIAVSPASLKDPKSLGESSVGPRIRNGISRRLGGIAVLVQSNLAFLTFIDLHLHSQTVSDYHPLFYFIWIFKRQS